MINWLSDWDILIISWSAAVASHQSDQSHVVSQEMVMAYSVYRDA